MWRCRSAPEATLVDITHEIAPQDVLGGALELAACCSYFPHGTIFVAVIDPGVGSSRRAIAVRAGDYLFVAPDNGVLTVAIHELGWSAAVQLSNRFALPTVSRTFEGRDRFAPAAAWLARGTPLDEIGTPIADVRQLDLREPRVSDHEVSGEVLRIDRFGNAITNIRRSLLESWLAGAEPVVVVGEARLPRLVSTYAEVAAGLACALFSSSDHLEIAVVGGSAAANLRLGRGSVVTVRKASSASSVHARAW